MKIPILSGRKEQYIELKQRAQLLSQQVFRDWGIVFL